MTADGLDGRDGQPGPTMGDERVAGAPAPVGYVLPIRRDRAGGDVEELASYLGWLAGRVEVVVVDGSPPDVFAAHAHRFGAFCRHVAPDPELRFRNGKVNGVLTGLRVVAAERVVVADDDVRYDEASLDAVADALCDAELVRPQNYFACDVPLPWHARWDTARTLLNRAFGQDYPGTLGVRRSFLLAAGGYDGDVLFENLQLIRTVRALAGRVAETPGIFVRRLPPTARRFWSQRVRQAYDELAQPARLAVFLSVVPASAAAAARRPRALLAGAAASVAVAEVGRRRAGGTKVFPFSATLFAPLWLLERGVCSWAAVGARMFLGGCPYRGTVIRHAARSIRSIRRYAGTQPIPSAESARRDAADPPGSAGPQTRSRSAWVGRLRLPSVRGAQTGSAESSPLVRAVAERGRP